MFFYRRSSVGGYRKYLYRGILAGALLLGLSAATVSAASFTSGGQTIDFTPANETAEAAEAEGYSALAYSIISVPAPENSYDIYKEVMEPESVTGTYAETGIPAVALTFDDGPGDGTEGILDTLEANNAHATFFIVGQNARNHADLLKREVALGCELGTHTWDHTDLVSISLDAANEQITKSVSAIEKYSGGKVTVMRPPYGDINDELKQDLQLPIVLWSLDTLDWKTRDAASTLQTVKDNVQGGDIILFHDLYTETSDAVEQIVPWLIENGYKLLTVSEMYEYYGEDLCLHKGHGCA